MQALDWRGKFDVAVCAFGVFFAEDMSSQLLRIADTVKPGGRVMISSFAKDYMQSLRSLMVARLGRFSIETPLQTWLRTAEPQACLEALRTPDGVWMDVPALVTIGSKPGSDG